MTCSQWILRPGGVCSLNSLYWSLGEMHRLICVFPRCTYHFVSFVVPGPDCPYVAIRNENGQSYHKFKNRQLWATSWQNQQNGICAKRRLRSAWASAQSDQSSLCVQWVAKDPRFLHADSEDWSDWADAQADLSLRWAHTHFVGFVLRQLLYLVSTLLSTPEILILVASHTIEMVTVSFHFFQPLLTLYCNCIKLPLDSMQYYCIFQ